MPDVPTQGPPTENGGVIADRQVPEGQVPGAETGGPHRAEGGGIRALFVVSGIGDIRLLGGIPPESHNDGQHVFEPVISAEVLRGELVHPGERLSKVVKHAVRKADQISVVSQAERGSVPAEPGSGSPEPGEEEPDRLLPGADRIIPYPKGFVNRNKISLSVV